MEGTAQREAPARVARPSEDLSYAVRFSDGSTLHEGRGEPKFTVRIGDRGRWRKLLASNAYSVAQRYVSGEFDLEGDFVEAVRFDEATTACLARMAVARRRQVASSTAHRPEPLRSARDVRFHYDRSNEFYRLFVRLFPPARI
jgi:cyclopropane-fatty-acyl-phospholipid synthase